MEKELFRTSRSFVSLDIEMLNDLNSSRFNLFFGLVLTTPSPHSVKTNMNTEHYHLNKKLCDKMRKINFQIRESYVFSQHYFVSLT